MKKILVVGGAGYIGSIVVNNLVDLGYKVTVLDNLSTGHKFLINKKVKFIID
jgi:UDP-glucose 4-epimerase